jgi:hypothetical protein
MVLLYINTKRRHATEWRSGRVVGQHLLHGDAVGLSGTARTGSGSDGTRRSSRAGPVGPGGPGVIGPARDNLAMALVCLLAVPLAS